MIAQQSLVRSRRIGVRRPCAALDCIVFFLIAQQSLVRRRRIGVRRPCAALDCIVFFMIAQQSLECGDPAPLWIVLYFF